MRFKNWSFAACLFFATCLSANPADDFFQKGNSDFQRGDFASAAKNYESALAEGQVSATVFSNLAQAHFQQKNYARSILNFERALLLAPADKNLQQDLELARRRADVETEQKNWFSAFLEKTVLALPPNFWAVASLVFAWLAAAGFFLIWKKSLPFSEKIGLRLAIGGAVAFAIALFFAFQTASWQLDSQAGIVLSEATVHPAPDGSTDVLEDLRAGEKVLLVESLSGWWKIRLSSGGTAWVAGGSIEKI